MTDVATVTPLFLGFGAFELGVLGILVVLLFGADKLPEIARNTGVAFTEFKKGREVVERGTGNQGSKSKDTTGSTSGGISGDDPRERKSKHSNPEKSNADNSSGSEFEWVGKQ